MKVTVAYHLSEPQAVAILAAFKRLTPEQVATLSTETRDNLSIAYHRLNGALVRSLQNGDPEIRGII